MQHGPNQGYQVIARRWRPKEFSELVGQDHIVRTLRNAIQQNRIAHAYLFIGPRGTGKTSTARLLAKALNCEGGPRVENIQDSDISNSILHGSCMDVIEIDGASNNSVDQIRDLREDCQYAPAQCRYKIYIIDEVHMLSTAAFNALLKTLEEPPSHVIFIFATTEYHKVLPTITSRCQRFEFKPIPESIIAEKLSEIARTEGVNIDSKALNAMARLANGGMRDAQSILDQVIAFCGKSITEDDLLDIYGLVRSEMIDKMIHFMIQGDYKSLLNSVDELVVEGRDLYRVLLDLKSSLRDILMDRFISKQSEHEHLSNLEGISRGDSPRKPLLQDADFVDREGIIRMLRALHDSEEWVKRGLSQRVNFEIALLKAMEQGRMQSIDSLIKEILNIMPENNALGPQKKKIHRVEEVGKRVDPLLRKELIQNTMQEPVSVMQKGESLDIIEEEVGSSFELDPAFVFDEKAELCKSDSFDNFDALDNMEGHPSNDPDPRIALVNHEGNKPKSAIASEPSEISMPAEQATLSQNKIQNAIKSLPEDVTRLVEELFRGNYTRVRKLHRNTLLH